ncbi:hypothetical protein [Microbacterium sp. NPDC058389]|uniref:hypothetical protein n=1 Tax=Microbacterium sp. NPDC058389 TaxID=3346475 RepID=UPI0036598EA6
MRTLKYFVALVVAAALALVVAPPAQAVGPGDGGTICPNGVIVYNMPCPVIPTPRITVAATTEPNAAGWYSGPVTIRFTCLGGLDSDGDLVSTIPDGACPPDQVLTESGPSTAMRVLDSNGVAGVSNTVSVLIDSAPPTVTAAATTEPNAAGWYRSPVTIGFTCDDGGGSGIVSGTCPINSVLLSSMTSRAMTVQDVAGNISAPSNQISVRLDWTAPTITASVSETPNAGGWYRTAPVVSFDCREDTPPSVVDGESGVAACAEPVTLGEGAAQTVTGTAVDAADNTAQAVVTGLDVDLTPPSVAWSGGPLEGETYAQGGVPAAPTCSATDALSGAGTCSVSGYATTQGTHTLTATATDLAGNTAVESRTYVVLAGTTGSLLPLKVSVREIACSDPSATRALRVAWKVPSAFAGRYRVTVTLASGWSTSTVFRLDARAA